MRSTSSIPVTGVRPDRRRFLRLGLAGLVVPALPAWAKLAEERALALHNLHTGESLALTYYAAGAYDEVALAAINHALRDFRTGDVHPIHTGLLDQLALVHAALGSDAPFQIISGYRSPLTNERLRQRSGGVASRSLHMDGKAIDVRLADTRTTRLRDVAAALGLGGVGYYARSDFVHLDVGRPRQW